MNGKIYGWELDGKFFFSRSPKPRDGDPAKPANSYETKIDAVREAQNRGLVIEWQQ